MAGGGGAPRLVTHEELPDSGWPKAPVSSGASNRRPLVVSQAHRGTVVDFLLVLIHRTGANSSGVLQIATDPVPGTGLAVKALFVLPILL